MESEQRQQVKLSEFTVGDWYLCELPNGKDRSGYQPVQLWKEVPLKLIEWQSTSVLIMQSEKGKESKVKISQVIDGYGIVSGELIELEKAGEVEVQSELYSEDPQLTDEPEVAVAAPQARRSDPSTSHQAAERLSPRASSVDLELLGYYKKSPMPMTDEDLCELMPGESPSTVRGRRCQLVKADLLQVVDLQGVSRRGNTCQRFGITGKGRRYYKKKIAGVAND